MSYHAVARITTSRYLRGHHITHCYSSGSHTTFHHRTTADLLEFPAVGLAMRRRPLGWSICAAASGQYSAVALASASLKSWRTTLSDKCAYVGVRIYLGLSVWLPVRMYFLMFWFVCVKYNTTQQNLAQEATQSKGRNYGSRMLCTGVCVGMCVYLRGRHLVLYC